MLPNAKTSLLIVLSVCLFSLLVPSSDSLTLSTKDRWIVDSSTGKRVKLTCVSWSSHLSPMLVEGLHKLPLKDIVAKIASHGFNCVRLTWATYMFTRHGNDIVGRTFDVLKLQDAKAGLRKHNSFVLNMTHLQAFDAVVDALGQKGVMVVLDNHVSEPKWCCDSSDGNGFFGDTFFNPHEWLQGLTLVAQRFNAKSQVVAMSLRNELRGRRQNPKDWYKFMRQGASAVHTANSNVLVILSGLSYDTDLTFLKSKPFDLNLNNKLVFEVHLYSWTAHSQEQWVKQPLNRICANTIFGANNRGGFLFQGANPTPLFFSEFGYAMAGNNPNDARYLSCLLAYLAANDLDWSLWALQGSYYLRQQQVGAEETYGLLDSSWKKLRDRQFPQKFQLPQKMMRDATVHVDGSYILYHPLTGLCVHVNKNNELQASDCRRKSRWNFNQSGSPIWLTGTKMCLKVNGDGKPPTLSGDCSSKQSAWTVASRAQLQLASIDAKGQTVCLHKDADSVKIVTRKCICTGDDPKCMNDPRSQWFQLTRTNLN